MDTITGSQGFLWTIADMAISVKYMAIKFAVMFAMITAIYGVVKYYMGFEDDQKPNFKKYVFIPLILVFLLANYGTMIDITGRLGSIMITSTPGHEIDGEEMIKSINNSLEEGANQRKTYTYMKAAVPKESFWEKLGDYARIVAVDIGNDVSGLLSFAGAFIQVGFIQTTRSILLEARNVILGIMIIIGPLAILFSILPVFRENFIKWFRTYVAIILWAVTMNIIDGLVVGYYKNANDYQLAFIYQRPDGSQFTNKAATPLDEDVIIGVESIKSIYSFGLEGGFINFIFALSYLMIPLLTSFFIGDRAAQGFLSYMMTKATSVIMSAGKIAGAPATGGASMAGGGGKGTTSGLQ